ncbi:MAG: hypothetical protein M4579_001874 [Chaenotheca gracillima]|nr:MAG: hypothetical protein M4579_001874 [Chaenotheca gracillima]
MAVQTNDWQKPNCKKCGPPLLAEEVKKETISLPDISITSAEDSSIHKEDTWLDDESLAETCNEDDLQRTTSSEGHFETLNVESNNLKPSSLIADDERTLAASATSSSCNLPDKSSEIASFEEDLASEPGNIDSERAESSQEQDEEKLEEHSDESQWTMYKAFFGVAGGLVVKTDSFRTQEFLTMTPAGIAELARLEILPSISTADIEDKSKADPVAKLLVCGQAGWFIAQCIARLAQKLPLTLLEIHTLAHVLVAGTMFTFWFTKIYNAISPIISTDPEVTDAAALLALCVPESSLTDLSRTGELKCSSKDDIELVNVTRAPSIIRVEEPESHTEKVGEDVDGSGLFNTASEDKFSYKSDDSTIASCAEGGLITSSAYVRPISLEYLRRARRAVQRLRLRGIHFTWKECDNGQMVTDGLYGVSHIADFRIQGDFADTKINLKERKGMSSFCRPSQRSMLYPLAALYAAFHLMAWNAHFPTSAERHLWRGAGLCVIALPVLAGVDWLLFVIQRTLLDLFQRSRFGQYLSRTVRSSVTLPSFVDPFWMLIVKQLWYMLVWGSLTIINFTASAGARSFFTIEAFISLRNPENGTYAAIEWTNFLPHA